MTILIKGENMNTAKKQNIYDSYFSDCSQKKTGNQIEKKNKETYFLKNWEEDLRRGLQEDLSRMSQEEGEEYLIQLSQIKRKCD
jgi:hypothetical protein